MSKKSILVVDDDPRIVNSIFDMLDKTGKRYTFYQAVDGNIAYKAATSKQPDLIITDWDMPEINGIELVKMLKSNPETADIPVIMSSGVMVSSKNLKTALDAGAVDYIRKPIDKVELAARVNSMLLMADYIKEIKAKTQTIEENNIFLKELINTIPNPIVHYDVNGICYGYNKQFQKVFNISNEENQTASVYNFFIKDGVDIHFREDRKLLEGKKSVHYETQVTYADDTVHEIIFTKGVFHDNNNVVKGIICIMSDVSELKQAHRDAVERQKKDLASISMRLIQTNELNEKIINDISALTQYSNKKGNERIREIINNYKYVSNESIWDEFELRFNEVYRDFHNNLNKTHPDLTSNERKLCAFLRLNMTSKEIAAITFQNPKSIDMARYRLRKKLNLAENDNLIAYISKF